MNNSAVNFTTLEASTNSTSQSTGLMDSLNICVFIIGFLLGVPTNVYMIWLIVTGSGVASEFFNLNLSICELGNSLNCLVYALLISFSNTSNLPMFSVGLVFTGRPLFQCLMCVERYLAVVHPVTFLKYKPLRYRVICCTAAWMITLGSCFSCLFIDFFKNGEIHAEFLSLQFLLFFCIQLFCLVAVLRALKQSGPGERRREREENHLKRKAFLIILITTLGMTITYVPFTITGLFTIVTNQYVHTLWITGLICYILAGVIQPALYLQRTGKLSCLCAS